MENGSYYYDKQRKRWRIQYTDPNTGKRKPIYGKTIEEVQTKHNKIKVAMKNGTLIEKSKDSFTYIMDTMLEEQEANHDLKPGSMYRKKRTAKLISQTEFAKKAIQKIDADQIKKDLSKFSNLKKPDGKYKYSQSYLDKMFSLTREVFNYAVDNEKILLEQSPFKTKTKIKKPKAGKKPKKVTALNIEQTKMFLKQLLIETDKYKDCFWPLILSGIRPGECLAIRSKNCDLDQNIISIDISLTKDENDKTVLGEDTKTENRSKKNLHNPYVKRNYRT